MAISDKVNLRILTDRFSVNYPTYKPIIVRASIDVEVAISLDDDTQEVIIDITDKGGDGGATLLSELTDVEITSPTEGDALVFNGDTWVNQPVSGSSGSLTAYSFLVNFTGTDPSSISGAPSGWTITIPSTGVIQIVHNKQSQPIVANIWGKASGSPETWGNRIVGLTAINMTYLFSTRLTTTTLNNVSTNTAAAQGGQARVELIFAT